MLFKNKTHEPDYKLLLRHMGKDDCYHQALAYLLSLCKECYDNADMLYDFGKHRICLENLNAPWQTGTSYKVTKLAFNLFNGCCWQTDKKGDFIQDGNGNLIIEEGFTPSELFCCSYAPYFWQAIKLRFPEYCNK